MTATELADALAASRSRAIAALGKAYIRREETPDDDLFRALMHSMGLDDDIAVSFLLHAWAILREQRTEAPGEALPAGPKPMSPAQRSLILKMCSERGLDPPDEQKRYTWEEASGLIDAIKAGTYNPDEHTVPF